MRRRLAIEHQGERIEYSLAHRPRITRRVHLELDETGGLRVVKPRRMSARAVHRLLQQNTAWVADFVTRTRQRQREIPPMAYTEGELHGYLGEQFPLRRSAQLRRGSEVCLRDGAFHMPMGDSTEQQARLWMRAWYRQRAFSLFSERLEIISAAAEWVGSDKPVLKLRRMKRTWGSCSRSGVITLNPHLVKAPLESIDYVVAHEVCHLAEHNHGPGFYILQSSLNPEWRAQQTRLRQRGHIYLHE